MNITLDDPRLTAYALDELDVAERSVIESEMQKFGECRREVQELTRAVGLIQAGLASEPAPALLPVQQRAIEAKLKFSGSKQKLSWIPSAEKGRLNWFLKTALAVAVVLLIGMPRIPLARMNPALSFLQKASTDTACTMMLLAGIPVTKRESMLIVQDAGRHQIVSFGFPMPPLDSGCTPFYSSLILLVASLLLGNLYLRSPWKRLLLTLFVIPLVVGKEALRMFAIAELCVHVSKFEIDSPVLHHGSSIFFALSLIPFVFFLVCLRKLESKR